MGRSLLSALVTAVAYSPFLVAAADDALKVDNNENILEAGRTLSSDLIKFYKDHTNATQPAGLLPEKQFHWWESGSFMGAFVDYWHLTNDSTDSSTIQAGLYKQTGEDLDYMPANQTLSLANDDQCTWAIAALQAAESNFPSNSSGPAWVDLAKTVFDTQVNRIDNETCGGGLRWQINIGNIGYDYKNSISAGCFFNLGARLARYTSNATYADNANLMYDWLEKVGFLDAKSGAVYDGAHAEDNCKKIDKGQYSYSAALINFGAAAMYNQTTGDDSEKWRARVETLTDSILKTFFPDGVAIEPSCEKAKSCTTDMLTMKGLAIRWLANVSQLAPFTADKIRPVIKKSAEAAAKACSGSKCSFSWVNTDDKEYTKDGVREKMNALAAISNLLIEDAEAPIQKPENSTESSPTETSEAPAASTSADQGGAASRGGFALTLMMGVVLVSVTMTVF